MPSERNTSSHSTLNERQFIKHLGSHHKKVKTSKLELLKKYRKALRLRHDFGDINEPKIYNFVDELIREEEGEA